MFESYSPMILRLVHVARQLEYDNILALTSERLRNLEIMFRHLGNKPRPAAAGHDINSAVSTTHPFV